MDGLGKDAIVSTRKAAELLGVNDQTMRRWLREGTIRGHFVGGSAGYKVTVGELRRFLEGRPQQAPKRAPHPPPPDRPKE